MFPINIWRCEHDGPREIQISLTYCNPNYCTVILFLEICELLLLTHLSKEMRFKGIVSGDGFGFWWHVWVVLGLKGCVIFYNFLGAPIIL